MIVLHFIFPSFFKLSRDYIYQGLKKNNTNYHTIIFRLSVDLGQKPVKGWKRKKYHGMWVGDGVVVGVGLGVMGRGREIQKHAFECLNPIIEL